MLAPQKVDVIMEYITKILDDTEKISGLIEFNTAKINGQNMCTVDIYVPSNNFERHLNLGITNDHQNIVYKEFLDRILEDVLPSENIGATRFYSLRTSSSLFDGINVTNLLGGKIKVNLYGIDKSISDEYNLKYEEFQKNLYQVENDDERKV